MEKDLEDAILRELEKFLLELGPDSPFRRDNSASPSTPMTITWISFSTTGH
jgi:hypothetical protein